MVARASVFDALEATKAHLTTSAEAQKVEDMLKRIAQARSVMYAPGFETFGRVDAAMKELDVPESEWDTLYRIRMQVEASLLRPAPTLGLALPPERGEAAPATPALHPVDLPALGVR